MSGMDMLGLGLSQESSKLSTSHHEHNDKCLHDASGDFDQNSHSIFEAIKAGMLVPVQTIAENFGSSVFGLLDDKGHTPAHWACLGGHATILRYMIENKAPVNEASNNDLGARPIHWACVNGHIAVVDILMQVGVPIDIVDNKGCTPLIVAAQYGQTMLAGYLMGKGCQLQVVDKDGDNSLHWSSFKGFSEMMRLLIYSGFNPRQRDNFGQTPLHLACINGNLTAVQELCEQDGVEINLADKNGKTPLMLSKGRKHDAVVEYLNRELRYKNSLLPRIDFWTIVFGPPGNSKGAILFFLVNILCWGYPMYVLKCLPLTWNDLQTVHLFFMFTNVVMWFCLFHASTTDPGFLPRNIPEYDMAIKRVAHFDEWKQGENPLSRLCHTCRTVKPLRAKHCKICNRCVKVFDHHCPYIYNCVGYRNRHWFLFFVCTVLAMIYFANYFCYYMLKVYGWDWIIVIGATEAAIICILLSGMTVMMPQGSTHCSSNNLNKRLSFTAFCTCVMVNGFLSLFFSHYLMNVMKYEEWNIIYYFYTFLGAFFSLVAIYLTLFMVIHAGINLTTNERINRNRYKHFKDEHGNIRNPFERSLKENYLEFCYLIPGREDLDVDFNSVRII